MPAILLPEVTITQVEEKLSLETISLLKTTSHLVDISLLYHYYRYYYYHHYHLGPNTNDDQDELKDQHCRNSCHNQRTQPEQGRSFLKVEELTPQMF